MSQLALRSIVVLLVFALNQQFLAQAQETATGTVVDQAGKPVADVRVVAFRGGKQLDEVFVTDAQGQFFAPKKWRESHTWLTIVAIDPQQRLGWFDCMIHGHSDEGQKADDRSFRLVLLPFDRRVQGRIVDQSGKPIPNVPIRILQLNHKDNLAAVHWQYQTLDGLPLVPQTKTDNEGRYELRLPADTMAVLKTFDSDWVESSIIAAKDKGVLPDTTLVSASTIKGRVVDARTGKPLSGIQIDAYASKTKLFQSRNTESKTDAQGNYSIRGLRAGEHTVVLRKATERILSAPAKSVVLEPGATATVDFGLQIAKRLTGRVVDIDTGDPIPGCNVRYSGPAYPLDDVRLLTNAAGEFSLYALPGVSKLDASDGRRFGADSSKEIRVNASDKVKFVELKVGKKLQAVAGEVKVFVGPPLKRRVTVDFDRIPFAEALKQICDQAGVRLDFDQAAFKAAGHNPNQNTTIKKAGRTSLENALNVLLKPYAKFTFEITENRVAIRKKNP